MTAMPTAPTREPIHNDPPIHQSQRPVHESDAKEAPMAAPPAPPTNTATNARTRAVTDGSAESGSFSIPTRYGRAGRSRESQMLKWGLGGVDPCRYGDR